jgi:predicted dehydrogenase
MTKESVGVGLLGYGYWGRNLARNIRAAPGCELVAVAEPDAGARQLLKGEAAILRIDREPASLLEREEVDAVVVATPVATHFELAKAALLSGRHVLVEKPLALSTAEARQLVELSKDRKLVLMVGHTFLYSPPVNMLRDLVIDGSLGVIQYLYSQRLNLGRVRSDCDALWNFGPHDVSIMMYLLGEIPREVSARGFPFLQDGISDVVFATLAFPSGQAAHLHVSWVDPRKVRTITVVGTRRMAVYDDVSMSHKLAVYDCGVEKVPAGAHSFESLAEHQWKTRPGDVYLPHVEMSEPLFNEISEFIGACATGRDPLTNGAHGLAVVAVLDAIAESSRRKGRSVTVEGAE